MHPERTKFLNFASAAIQVKFLLAAYFQVEEQNGRG